MKRLIVASLSILTLSLATTTAVKAAPQVGYPAKVAVATNSKVAQTVITPFELVSRAYQGDYRLQGIPGFGSFISDSNSGRITAKTLVQAAIDAKELSPEMTTDSSYLSDIEQHLFSMGK